MNLQKARTESTDQRAPGLVLKPDVLEHAGAQWVPELMFPATIKGKIVPFARRVKRYIWFTSTYGIFYGFQRYFFIHQPT